MKIKRLTQKRIISRYYQLLDLMYKREDAQGKALAARYNRSVYQFLKLMQYLDPATFGEWQP